MSKLHIPGPEGFALTSCGRQLNNHRADRAQDAKGASLAVSLTEYMDALKSRKACRHCGRASGILPRVIRAPIRTDWGDSDE